MALADTETGPAHPAESSSIQMHRWVAGLGAAALALAGLGVGSAVFGGLEVLANWRPLLLGGAIVVMLVAWTLLLRGRL
jgi:hypothetical protein